MAWEQEIKFLAETEAKRVSYEKNSQTTDAQLVRRFPVSRKDLQESGVRFLDTYGSVLGTLTAKTYVDDPMADGKTYTGRWRVVSNQATPKETDEAQQGIIQVLRLGYVTTISATPASWDEARLVEDAISNQSGNAYGSTARFITIRFPNIAPGSMQSLVAGLSAATYANPVIKGQTYTGTWRGLMVTGRLMENDGAGEIVVLMGDPEFQLTSFSDLGTPDEQDIIYLFNVPRDLAQSILTAWEALGVVGSSATVNGLDQQRDTVDLVLRKAIDDPSHSELDVLTMWDNHFKEWTSWYYGLAEAAADAITLSSWAISQHWELDRSLRSDGRWNVVVKKRVSSEARTLLTSARTAFTTENQIMYQSYRALFELPTTVGAGGEYRLRANLNDDGTYSGDITYAYSDAGGMASFASDTSTLVDGIQVIYRRRSSVVDAPADSRGIVYQSSNTLNDDGTYNAQLQYQYAWPYSAEFVSRRTPFKTTTEVAYTSYRGMLTAPAITGTGQYQVQQTLNRDGTYSGSVAYTDGSDAASAVFQSQYSELEQIEAQIYQDSPTLIELPAGKATVGHLYQVSNRITEDGLYDGQVTYQTNTPTTAATVSQRAPFETVSTILYRAYPHAIEAGTASAGHAYRVNQSLGPDGTYSGELSFSAVTGSHAHFQARYSALEQVDEILYKSSSSPATAETASVGYIYQVSNALQDNGLYDAHLQYQLNLYATVVADTVVSPFETTKSILYRSYPQAITIDTAPSVGQYRVSQSLGPDGTYSGELNYSTSAGATPAEFRSQSQLLERTDEMLYKSYAAIVTADDPSAGYVYRASNVLNDNGLYDSRLQYQTNVDAAVQLFLGATPFETTVGVIYKDYRTVFEAPDPWTDQGSYQIQETVNPDGTYSGVLRFTGPSGDGGAYKWDSVKSSLSNSVSVLYKSRPTGIAASASQQGKIYEATNDLTEEGLYNARLVYRGSVPAGFYIDNARSPFAASVLYSFQNSLAIPQLPDPVAQGQYRVNAEIQQDGTYSGNLTYAKSTGAGVVAFASDRASLSQQDSIIYKDYSTYVNAPASAQGYTYQAMNELTDDGLYNARLVYAASNAVAADIGLISTGARECATGLIYRSYQTMPSAPAHAQGYTYQLGGVAINEDGTYNGQLQYQYSQPYSTFTTWPTQHGNALLYHWINQTTVPDAVASLSDAYSNSVSVQMNADGTYDVTAVCTPVSDSGWTASTILRSPQCGYWTQDFLDSSTGARKAYVTWLHYWSREDDERTARDIAFAQSDPTAHSHPKVTPDSIQRKIWFVAEYDMWVKATPVV